MKIWLIKEGEPIPSDEPHPRLLRAYHLAEQLVLQGHEVVWFNATFIHQKKVIRSPFDDVYQLNDRFKIQLIDAGQYKKNISFARLRFHRNLAKRLIGHFFLRNDLPDIIVSGWPSVHVSAAAVRFAREKKIPIVLDLRDMWPDIIPLYFPSWLRFFAKVYLWEMYRAAGYAAKHATGLVGITESFLDWGLQHANRKKSVFDGVFPFAYPLMPTLSHEERFSAESFWASLNIVKREDECLLVYLGVLNDSVPLDEMITAVSGSKRRYRFVIGGVGQYAQKYQRASEKNPRVIYAGWLNANQIQVLLGMADIGFVPHLQRQDFLASIPNKVIEYLAHGVPVLSTLNGETGNLLLRESCGFVVEPGSLSYFLENLSFIELPALSKSALACYIAHYRAEEVYQRYGTFLESIVEKFYKDRYHGG